jgi:hypothetical protein
MTAVTKTKDYLRMLVGIGLIGSIYMAASLPRIPFAQIATLLFALCIWWATTLGYRWLTKKIGNLFAFPVF